MPPHWMRTKEDEEDTSQERTIEIKPEQIRDALKDDLGKISKMEQGLDTVLAFVTKQQEREAAEARKAEEASRKENEPDAIDWNLDPESATKKMMRPVIESQAAMIALYQRKELLGSMDYYSSDPEFKSKVDALIDAQPLANRGNAGVIMAAYKNVHYDMRKEIEEGKVKSQASINAGNGRGSNQSTGGSDSSDGSSITMSNEEKIYARKLGISEAAWVKQKKELEYV